MGTPTQNSAEETSKPYLCQIKEPRRDHSCGKRLTMRVIPREENDRTNSHAGP
jgi:hypothetical protein